MVFRTRTVADDEILSSHNFKGEFKNRHPMSYSCFKYYNSFEKEFFKMKRLLFILIVSLTACDATTWEHKVETETELVYKPTRVAVRFLHDNDGGYQALQIDTIYLDSQGKILWEIDKSQHPNG